MNATASTLQYTPGDEMQVGNNDEDQLVDPPSDSEVDDVNTDNDSGKWQCQSQSKYYS